MAGNRGYMQQYAMSFGTLMGVYWLLKFILFPLGMLIPFLSFFFVAFTLYVPFVGYKYVRRYRDLACGGNIGFFHAWVYTVMMYLFAAMLTAVGHYIYFRFIDQGFIVQTLSKYVEMMSAGDPKSMQPYLQMYAESLEMFRQLTPAEIVMQLLSSNVFFGLLLGIPTALFVMRHKEAQEKFTQS